MLRDFQHEDVLFAALVGATAHPSLDPDPDDTFDSKSERQQAKLKLPLLWKRLAVM